MAITKQTIEMAVESVKDFFKNLLKPNMTLEDINEVVNPRLVELIEKHEKKGLQYSAGKFHIKYVDEKNFQLEFEMYFKDEEDQWHKVANESELREVSLLEEGAAKTIKALKIITFPIELPEAKAEKETAPAKEEVKKISEESKEIKLN